MFIRPGQDQTLGTLAGEARKRTQWLPIDMRWRWAGHRYGVFDEEKTAATVRRHVANSLRWLRISIRIREGCKGERNADNPARETL